MDRLTLMMSSLLLMTACGGSGPGTNDEEPDLRDDVAADYHQAATWFRDATLEANAKDYKPSSTSASYEGYIALVQDDLSSNKNVLVGSYSVEADFSSRQATASASEFQHVTTSLDVVNRSDVPDLSAFENNITEGNGLSGSLTMGSTKISSVSDASYIFEGDLRGTLRGDLGNGTKDIEVDVQSEGWFTHDGKGNDFVVQEGNGEIIIDGVSTNYYALGGAQ